MQRNSTIGELMERKRIQDGAKEYQGHTYMDLARFDDATKHMIIFDVLTDESPVGWKGERNRLYLSDVGYQKALDIVIQNDTGNKHAPTLIVATVTTRIHKKANMPTHFVIYDNPAFKEASVVQLEQIRTIDKSRIDNYLGKVTPREMVAIEKALSVSLAMEQLKKRSPKHKAKRAKE